MGPEIYKAGKLQLFQADWSIIRPIPSKILLKYIKIEYFIFRHDESKGSFLPKWLSYDKVELRDGRQMRYF